MAEEQRFEQLHAAHFYVVAAYLLARTDRDSAADAVGAALVVDGGIYRPQFVAEAVVSGLMQVQLETDAPVLSMVLTPHHFHDHEAHSDFFASHFEQRGAEVAHACALTIESHPRA